MKLFQNLTQLSQDGRSGFRAILAVAFILLAQALAGQELVQKKVLSESLQMLVPEGFDQLSDEIVAIKYPSGDRPTLVYGNEEATINLAFNHTEDGITKEELPDALSYFSGQFEQAIPSIEWYTKELKTINEKQYVYLEFQTPAIDTDIYNLMLITNHQERLLIISFNCTKEEKADWQKKARDIVSSIKVLK